jgi:hypothetical protein
VLRERARGGTMAYNFHTGAGAVGAAVLDEGFLVCLVRYWHGPTKATHGLRPASTPTPPT